MYNVCLYVVLGDSLMRQFWQALVCFFHSHLLMNDDPDLPIYDINWFLNNWVRI
jgi:hypothetical protein